MAELLKAGPLEFTNDEECPSAAKTAHYPKDMDEAHAAMAPAVCATIISRKNLQAKVPWHWPGRSSAAATRPVWS